MRLSIGMLYLFLELIAYQRYTASGRASVMGRLWASATLVINTHSGVEDKAEDGLFALISIY